jgi:hypothetical protein
MPEEESATVIGMTTAISLSQMVGEAPYRSVSLSSDSEPGLKTLKHIFAYTTPQHVSTRRACSCSGVPCDRGAPDVVRAFAAAASAHVISASR